MFVSGSFRLLKNFKLEYRGVLVAHLVEHAPHASRIKFLPQQPGLEYNRNIEALAKYIQIYRLLSAQHYVS